MRRSGFRPGVGVDGGWRHSPAILTTWPPDDVRLRLRPDPSGMQPRRLPASDSMRNELMASLGRADNDNLVEQSFVQKYGPTVLAAPTTQGFNSVAYLIPLAALIFGCGLIVLVIRAWKNRPTPAIAGGLRPVGSIRLKEFRDQARRETDL